MTVRDSMADLISRVRDLIGDPAGSTQEFTDQQIQNALDAHGFDHTREELSAVSSVDTAGVTTYLSYLSDEGFWEGDVLLQTGTYQTVDDASVPVNVSAVDYTLGRWGFNATMQPPVYITGRTYDVYAAAADVLELWLAKVKLDYDFLSSGRTFKRSQQIAGLESLIYRYRCRQRLITGIMVRTDMNVC